MQTLDDDLEYPRQVVMTAGVRMLAPVFPTDWTVHGDNPAAPIATLHLSLAATECVPRTRGER